LVVNLQSCNRTGICYFTHPELFREGDDGFPVPLPLEGDAPFPEAAAEDAVTGCPTGSIAVVDEES
jgi:ferredoxin